MKREFRWRGVVFFGEPGTGKTTIARALREKVPNSFLLEISEEIIKRLAGIKDFPVSLEDLLKDFMNSPKKTVGRKEARDIAVYVREKYGNDAMGQIVGCLGLSRQMSKKFLIVSGGRGVDTAKHLQSSGYLVVFLRASRDAIIARRSRERGEKEDTVVKDLNEEEKIYQTRKIEKVADLVFDTSKDSVVSIVNTILVGSMEHPPKKECVRCVNTDLNPSISFDRRGYCNICQTYLQNFNKKSLAEELSFIRNLASKTKSDNASMVGISGGKDSTATLYLAKELGLRPTAFTLDIGYYPKHTFKRAREVANKFGIAYERLDIRKYIEPSAVKCYRLMAALYDEKESPSLSKKFRDLYQENRKHYSVKCEHVMPFVRTCQLCRKTVIRAYYAEALKRNISLIILGANEWAGLSLVNESTNSKISAIRKLQPDKSKPAVYVVHLPFLLQRKLKDNRRLLQKLGWQTPAGEAFVESNSNSCLLGLAAEDKASRMLGFSPDTTRLAREVTVGFLTKSEARRALSKVHKYKNTVRQVLKKARII